MEIKVCKRCRCPRMVTDYYTAKGGKNGLNATCKFCISEKFKARYRSGLVNKDDLYNKRIAQKLRITQALAHRYREGCVDCGSTNFTHLQWDHQDNVTKILAFSKMWGRKDEDILSEVEKCELRCANCHQVRTSKQFKWIDWMDIVDHPEKMGELLRDRHS